MASRPLTVTAALACAGAMAACGLGPGSKSARPAFLDVTRDYGAARVIAEQSQRVAASENAIRLLERHAKVGTRYGGRFVQSVEGISGSGPGGNRDWFLYVNGIESPVGGAEISVHGGDRVWWDYRDWGVVNRVPAVVGSWPEPMVHGFRGRPFTVHVDCPAATSICHAARARLASARVKAALVNRIEPSSAETLRVLVGAWSQLRNDPIAAQLAHGPDFSGVFAHLRRLGSGWVLDELDSRSRPRATVGEGAGLVAAVRPGDGAPTWVITGTDQAGVQAAVGLLDGSHLRDRYAVATAGGTTTPLPVR